MSVSYYNERLFPKLKSDFRNPEMYFEFYSCGFMR